MRALAAQPAVRAQNDGMRKVSDLDVKSCEPEGPQDLTLRL